MRACLPEQFKIVDACTIVTTNGALVAGTGVDYVSLKNCIRAWLLITYLQDTGHGTTLQLVKATKVDATGATNFTNDVVKAWRNANVSASDTLVAEADLTNGLLTFASAAATHQVMLQIDPESLGAFDCISFTTSASSQAANFICAQFILQTKYKQATPPTAITD